MFEDLYSMVLVVLLEVRCVKVLIVVAS